MLLALRYLRQVAIAYYRLYGTGSPTRRSCRADRRAVAAGVDGIFGGCGPIPARSPIFSRSGTSSGV